MVAFPAARAALLALLALLATATGACAPGGLPFPATAKDAGALPVTDAGPPPATDSGAAAASDSGPPPDAGPRPRVEDFIWVTAGAYLARVDPSDYSVTFVEYFGWPPGWELSVMTDVAIDDSHTLYGVATLYAKEGGTVCGLALRNACGPMRLYTIDPATAACTHVAEVAAGLNGLAFVRLDLADPASPLVLLGVGRAFDSGLGPPSKRVYEIDPVTGSLSELGGLDDPFSWPWADDIVALPGAGIFVIVREIPSTSSGWDHLLSFDPATGTSAVVGEITGRSSVRGLAARDGVLLGFSHGQAIFSLDPADGSPTALDYGNTHFQGAASVPE